MTPWRSIVTLDLSLPLLTATDTAIPDDRYRCAVIHVAQLSAMGHRRNIIAIILSAFVFIPSVLSQGNTLSGGMKAGFNVSNMAFGKHPRDRYYGQERFYHAGLFANIPVTDRLSFRPELLYATKGANYADHPLSRFRPIVVHQYVSVPLLAGYLFGDLATIEIGPEVSYKLRTRIRDPQPDVHIPELWTKKVDISICAGIAFTIRDLMFSLRYNYGITALTSPIPLMNSDGNIIRHTHLRNRVFQLSAGIVYEVW